MYFKKPLNQLNTRVFSSNLESIPWDEAARIYSEAALTAERNAQEAAQAAYSNRYHQQVKDAVRMAGIDETEASFEGDIGIEYNPPEFSPEQSRKIRITAGNKALDEYFVKPYHLRSWGIKLLDQIVAEFSKHKLNSLGSAGTISGLQYLKDNLDPQSQRDLGIYRFLMMDGRSGYLDKMGNGDAKKYCTLVPLILYAHKLYNNVEYSQWERESLEFVVNPALCEAMLSEIPELSTQRKLELRNIGLNQAGKQRSASSTYSLYRLGDTEIANYNTLVKLMICQTWAAHPSNRTKYMVLDPMNWDKMPVPLVDGSIFKFEQPTTTQPLGLRTKLDSDVWF